MNILSVLFCVIAVALSTGDFERKRLDAFETAVSKLDFDQVKGELKTLFRDSKSWWPADYGHYGPFFIRLAWHCSGSYRQSDGRGGCEGGRQRFDPERSWADNTNLDKARKLLWPVKQKHEGLSWGDLFILAGTTAIEDLGGKTLGFCGGRVDAFDGEESLELGPTPEQVAVAPCAVNGTCKSPLGSTTVGLIYLNPEGPMGVADPEGSSRDVRDAFARMSMNDTETVALIGGGHSFGKSHGNCTTSPTVPGPSPKEDPENPWPAKCPDGGVFTAGFEGPWTQTPLTFNNEYFNLLLGHQWNASEGPGGHKQWSTDGESPQAPPPHPEDDARKQDIMMLTSDISLLHDEKYSAIVDRFAADFDDFEHAFMHAWYKLTTRDMGPVTRCRGNLTPPAQPFQFPLPLAGDDLPDFEEVRAAIVSALFSAAPTPVEADLVDGKPYYGAWMVQLAWQCASPYRKTDYLGGCNGGRIRYSPQLNWTENKGMASAIELLQPIKKQFGSKLSWSDLIVFSGQVAIEQAGGRPITFCPSRTDATDGAGWPEYLEPVVFANDPVLTLRERTKKLGMSVAEMVSLHGIARGSALQNARGLKGSWTNNPSQFSNEYFVTLLNETWEKVAGSGEYKAVGKELFMVESDLALTWAPEFMAVAQTFAVDNALFLENFAIAWNKLVNLDRFDEPACRTSTPPTTKLIANKLSEEAVIAISVGGAVFVMMMLFCVVRFCGKSKRSRYSDPLLGSSVRLDH